MANWNETEIGNFLNTTPVDVNGARIHVGLFQRTVDQMRVVGYPGPIFPAIHICALICLTVSVIVSVSLIIYRCCSCQGRKRNYGNAPEATTVKISVVPENVTTVKGSTILKPNPRQFRKFERWSISERLVIYLAIADTFVGFGTDTRPCILSVRQNESSRFSVCSIWVPSTNICHLPMDRCLVHRCQSL